MNKKFIALFAACSMISTAAMGLVHTAYADSEPNVRVEVTEGATDTEKVLTFYYEGVESLMAIQGYFDFYDSDENNLVDDTGEVTVDAFDLTIDYQYGEADMDTRVFYATESRKNKVLSSEDGAFATATITVPEDKDIILDYVIEVFQEPDGTDHTADIGDKGEIRVTIPKKAAPAPAREFSATKGDAVSFSTDDGYDANMVAAKYTLTIANGSYDLANAAYNGNTSEAITAADGSAAASTVITGAPTAEAVVFVVINGTADLAELDNVVFE